MQDKILLLSEDEKSIERTKKRVLKYLADIDKFSNLLSKQYKGKSHILRRYPMPERLTVDTNKTTKLKQRIRKRLCRIISMSSNEIKNMKNGIIVPDSLISLITHRNTNNIIKFIKYSNNIQDKKYLKSPLVMLLCKLYRVT